LLPKVVLLPQVVLLPLEAFLQKEVQLLLLKEALPLLQQVSNLLK
jgi:hypothetical protein